MGEDGRALISGANRGIGREVARQLAGRGWTVYLGARSEEKGRRAAEEMDGRVIPVRLDVADPESVREAVGALDALDVLVNNAGVYPEGDSSILQLRDEVLRETLETNTLGALRLAREVWPLLEGSSRARIINVSSGLGQLEDMGDESPAYCLSKTALNAVTRQLAGAGRRCGVSVNSVCPGWVRTDMGGSQAPRSVEEGADTIVWLATEAPAELTGCFLRDREPIPW